MNRAHLQIAVNHTASIFLLWAITMGTALIFTLKAVRQAVYLIFINEAAV